MRWAKFSNTIYQSIMPIDAFQQEHACAIIKPDAISDGLAESIKHDLEYWWLQIVLSKRLQITDQQVPYVYNNKVNSPRFPYFHYSITHWPAELLLLRWLNAHFVLKKLRWWSDLQGGIREKYQHSTVSDLLKRGITWPAADYVLCRNRLHASDTPQETEYALSWLLTQEEIGNLENICTLLRDRVMRLIAT